MLRIAIMGAGAIAAVHADAYKMFRDECQIVAVIDVYKEKAQALIENKALSEARAFRDFEDARKAVAIDMVSICLPPSLHAECSIAALEADCHVLVEKPMANSLEECDRMLETARRTGKLLGVVCQNRFKTPVMRVHEMLEKEVSGKVTHAIVNSLWWRGANYYDLWWRGTWENECGGCFTSHSVHHIDLLLWMLGMPESVTAVMKNVRHDNSEQEDVGVAILEYPDKLGQISSSIVDYGEEQEMVFQTERAKLSIPWKTAAAVPLPNGFPKQNDEYENELNKLYYSIPELPLEGHPALIKNFMRAIMRKEALLVDGMDGRRSIELIMAIYKSFSTRSQVKLPIAEDDPFYRKETMIRQMPHFYEKTHNIDNFSSSEITLGKDMGK